MILVLSNSLMKCVSVGCINSSAASSQFILRNRAPLGSFFTPTASGGRKKRESRVSFSIALFALARMSASEAFATLWHGVFGTLLMRICLAHKSHLARVLKYKLEGLGMQAAKAAAYVGYKVPFPVVGCCPIKVLGGGGEIAAMSFCVVPHCRFVAFWRFLISLMRFAWCW